MKITSKRIVALSVVLAMISTLLVVPASAEATVTVLSERFSGENLLSGITILNKYDNTDGGETTVESYKQLEYGVGGKLADDDSAHVFLKGLTEGDDFVKCDSHKQFYGYMVNNYAKTGYVVMEANVLPKTLNLGSFTVLTGNNHAIAQYKKPADVGFVAGMWNHVRVVVNMDSASLDAAPYRYPDVTAYINGVAYDMSKGASSAAIASYNPGRLIFAGESEYTYDQDVYWDDCATYLSAEDPGAPLMPAIEGDSGFTISGSDISLTGDVNISDLKVTGGTAIRVYDDSSMSVPLDANVHLTSGNIIVAANDTDKLYTTYYVRENLIAYANGNTVTSGLTLDTVRFSSTFKEGFAGKARGDISRYKDAGEGTVHDGVFYQTGGYTMSASSAKYLVAEMTFYPDMTVEQSYPFLYLSMKSVGHIDVTPRLRLVSDTSDVPCILPNRWNKVVYVIENRHIADGTDFSSTAVSDETAQAGKHSLTVFVNGKEVVSDYTMPYWGLKWSRGTSNFLRMGHYTNKDSQNDSHTAYDNVRIYEMDSFDKGAFTSVPTLAENTDVHYEISGNTLKIYDEFAVKVSELRTATASSVRAYTDGTFAKELDSAENLCAGNVIAVADTDVVTYYDVTSQTAASMEMAKADTASEWSALCTGGTAWDNAPGKPASDGALSLDSGKSCSINAWNGFEGSGYLITEFNVYAQQDASVALNAGTTALGAVSLEGGRWSRITVASDADAKTAEVFVNGSVVSSVTADIDYGASVLYIAAEGDTVYADDLRSYVTPLAGTVKYTPGKIYENENIIINGDSVKIKANTTKVSDIVSDGVVTVYRNGAIAGADEYISAGDVIYADNADHIGTYPVEGFTLDYVFANSDSGCAKGTVSIDLTDKFDYTLTELCWAKYTDGVLEPLEDYLPIKSFTGADLRKGYTITKDMFIPQEADAVLARYYYNGAEVDFTFEIPASKRMTDTEPELIIALSSDYHFGTNTADKEPTSKHDMTLKHINSYADAVVVNGDITNWWGSHSKAQIDAYQANKGAIGGDWENEPSQFDVAREYFEQFTIPVYMVQGNHDVPESGRYNINSTYGATASWRYSEYLNNWIDYSVEKGYYEDAIEREVDETYTGPSDKSNLATFYDDYVNGYHLIFLRVPYETGGKAYYDLMQQELDFLDRKLYEMEESGKPVFVFSHVPIEDTIGRAQETWENSQVRQQAFKDILNKHPNAIVVSGHSHFGLDNDWAWTVNGGQDKPSFVHDGGIVSQITPFDNDRNNDVTDYSKSSCVYAEIYGDRVVTRGYDLIAEKWIPQGISQITRNRTCPVGDIKVSKVARDGTVYLKAEGDADVAFEWTADGNSFEGAVLALNAEFDGFVAVRATNASGDYRSTSFKNLSQVQAGTFDVTEYDEGRTDYVSTKSSADDYILNNGQANGVTTYEKGIGGKASEDESAKLYIASGGRTWGAPIPNKGGASKRNWKQVNADSKYLVFSMNVMPASEDTVYALMGTNGGAPITAKSTDNLNRYQWNKLVGVYNIESGKVDTYINGKLVSDDVSVSFTSGYDIRVTFEGVSSQSTDTFELTGYADDVYIYETKNVPMLLWAQGLEDRDYGEGISADNETKTLYVTSGTTVAELEDRLNVSVSTADGFTRADGRVVSGDYAVCYDAEADAYSYYTVKVCYEAVFESGVADGVITEENVSFTMSAKDGGEALIVAQYDASGELVKAEIKALESKGDNTVSFAKVATAKTVKIMVWSNTGVLKPLTGSIDLSVK